MSRKYFCTGAYAPLPLPPLPFWGSEKDKVAVFGERVGFPASEVVGPVLWRVSRTWPVPDRVPFGLAALCSATHGSVPSGGVCEHCEYFVLLLHCSETRGWVATQGGRRRGREVLKMTMAFSNYPHQQGKRWDHSFSFLCISGNVFIQEFKKYLSFYY